MIYHWQKRKAEDGEVPPNKRTRAENREYDIRGSKKRKIEDQEESPSKRTRLDQPPKKPRGKSPAQQQARGRESTRVKEFPSGNITTSSSRISFLRSLCNIPQFLSLVDLVPALVRWPCLQILVMFNYSNLAKGFTHTRWLSFLGFMEKSWGLFASRLPHHHCFQQSIIYCEESIGGLQDI
jgi:hypothetical protein